MKRPYETVVADVNFDSDKARKLTRKAHEAMAISHWEKAEVLLREALVADVNYGPAHNSLGWLYYQQRQLYLAAWEFEYASRLMPELPEPLSNQGLVLEEAGRFDEAAIRYEEALMLAPEHPEVIANLARCMVRLDGLDRGEELRTAELLREVAFRDQRPEWRDWARELLDTQYVELADVLVGTCSSACPAECENEVRMPLPSVAPGVDWETVPLDIPGPEVQAPSGTILPLPEPALDPVPASDSTPTDAKKSGIERLDVGGVEASTYELRLASHPEVDANGNSPSNMLDHAHHSSEHEPEMTAASATNSESWIPEWASQSQSHARADVKPIIQSDQTPLQQQSADSVLDVDWDAMSTSEASSE